MNQCKYYNKHLDTIKEYINCLYRIDGCASGGMLHIVTDDNNLEDPDIFFCLKECKNNPSREESAIGALICKKLLKLPLEQRRLLLDGFHIEPFGACPYGECEHCCIETGYWDN